jgi:hypothetical protein
MARTLLCHLGWRRKRRYPAYQDSAPEMLRRKVEVRFLGQNSSAEPSSEQGSPPSPPTDQARGPQRAQGAAVPAAIGFSFAGRGLGRDAVGGEETPVIWSSSTACSSDTKLCSTGGSSPSGARYSTAVDRRWQRRPGGCRVSAPSAAGPKPEPGHRRSLEGWTRRPALPISGALPTPGRVLRDSFA